MDSLLLFANTRASKEEQVLANTPPDQSSSVQPEAAKASAVYPKVSRHPSYKDHINSNTKSVLTYRTNVQPS